MVSEADVVHFATQIQNALTDLGHAYTTHNGNLVQVSFRRLALAGDRYAVLEVDTNHLPPRVSIPKLESDEVLKHLSALIGKPVKRLNTLGLTYVVMLQPPPSPKPFPNSIQLPEAPADLAYPWPFGITCQSEPIWADLLTTGHLLLGGKPGAGKSTCLNAGLVSLLRRCDSDVLRLVLIDPKTVELAPFNGIPHLARPVATNPDKAAEAITWLVQEMERREVLFLAAGAKSLVGYNAKTLEPLPLVLAAIDEVTDLVILWGGPKSVPFLELIRLSSKGRAFGIVLCLATQNPKADILDTAIRENSGTRIAFKVDTAIQSRCILGQPGAENLPAKTPGRLMTDVDRQGLQTLQGFTVDDKMIDDLVARLRASPLTSLSSTEVALVAFARDHLEGTFTIAALAEHFQGTISKRQIEKIAQRWEARGWLTKPADVTSPRRVAEALLNLALEGGSRV